MAGSKKWFEYVTSTGDTFAILMDESNGEAVANVDYIETSTAVYALPRNVQPRRATYRSLDGKLSRTIVVGNAAATAATLPQSIPIDDGNGGSATGFLTFFKGEEFRPIPGAPDSGLDDGDAT